MALLFREIAQGRVKVSLRSVGDVDVAAFAKAYGGGGHTKRRACRSLARWRSPGDGAEAAREYLGQMEVVRGLGSRVEGLVPTDAP